MNSAQRAALNEMVQAGDRMASHMYNIAQWTSISTEEWTGRRELFAQMQGQWDAARNRYFELEAEAKQSRTAQQMARRDLGRKSTAGR